MTLSDRVICRAIHLSRKREDENMSTLVLFAEAYAPPADGHNSAQAQCVISAKHASSTTAQIHDLNEDACSAKTPPSWLKCLVGSIHRRASSLQSRSRCARGTPSACCPSRRAASSRLRARVSAFSSTADSKQMVVAPQRSQLRSQGLGVWYLFFEFVWLLLVARSAHTCFSSPTYLSALLVWE